MELYIKERKNKVNKKRVKSAKGNENKNVRKSIKKTRRNRKTDRKSK